LSVLPAYPTALKDGFYAGELIGTTWNATQIIEWETHKMTVASFDECVTKDSDAAARGTPIRKRFIKMITTAMNSFKSKNEKLPTICVFGHDGLQLATPIQEDYEEKRLDCRCYPSDSGLEKILLRDRPHIIITIGNRSSFPNLKKSPLAIQERWLHYDTLPDPPQLGIDAYNYYLTNILNDRRSEDAPLVTVFTPAYNTGERIYRPFQSLKGQTYSNWEWIIVDDSDDCGSTFKVLCDLAKKDHRIQVLKPWEHSGIIGRVKNWACSLGNGQILVELDHDDELTDYALDYAVKGFKQFPEAGFLYTDCAEIYEDGASHTYRNGWAFGYGSYADVEYNGQGYRSANAPSMNAKTIRHIISAPNHIRAWRKSFYESIGGHNKELHVADDYEIVVRTFLKTRMVRIPKLCYIQYIGNTTQMTRNKDIQRHVRSIRAHYDRMIHDRLLELGCEDFVWDEKKGCSDLSIPNPRVESHVTLIANV
jgi:glycosyltransferase involved in cell wall biosynthesis